MDKEVPARLKNQNSLAPLADTLQALTEALTGIAVSDRKDLFLSVGYLLQRLRGRNLLQVLTEGWEHLRQKGRIKADYSTTEQCQACLQEILDCVDHQSPDEIRFDFMKRIFLVAATETETDRASVLPQQLMSLARGLASGEILVLAATHELSKMQDLSKVSSDRRHESAQTWLERVAEKSGLQYPDLVEIHEAGLIDKRLITRRRFGDASGIDVGEHYRLTSLGFRLSEFVSSYDPQA